MFGNNKVMEVVELVWENREKIIDLIENLPQILQETGDNIESAGKSAVKTSLFLMGGDDVETDASELSAKAASALSRAYQEISEVAQVMAKVGEELGDIQIPHVEPEYRELMGVKVIAGLDVGKSSPLANVSNRLTTGSKRLDKLGDEMKDVAGSLEKLSDVLTDVGGDLHEMGLRLAHSGQTLTSVANFNSGDAPHTSPSRADDAPGGFSVTDV